MDSREVICADTNEWIMTQSYNSWPAVITSLPDREETKMELAEWIMWFRKMAQEVMMRVKPEGYAIFYQTDRKVEGKIVDKSYLCSLAADLAGAHSIFHKIALKRDVGATDLYRPTFTHLLCYSKKGSSGKATPDVFPAGRMIYNNAMGLTAARVAVEFVKSKGAKQVYDPFCGQGSILAVANKLGLSAIGVDILEEQCEKARSLKIT